MESANQRHRGLSPDHALTLDFLTLFSYEAVAQAWENQPCNGNGCEFIPGGLSVNLVIFVEPLYPHGCALGLILVNTRP